MGFRWGGRKEGKEGGCVRGEVEGGERKGENGIRTVENGVRKRYER